VRSIVTTGCLLVVLLDNGPTAPGICAFAVRRDAMRHNPGRDAARRAIGRGLGDYFDRLCDSIVTVCTPGNGNAIPTREFVGPVGLEPTTYGLKVRSSAN
jgi:hypothetical protein